MPYLIYLCIYQEENQAQSVNEYSHVDEAGSKFLKMNLKEKQQEKEKKKKKEKKFLNVRE